MRNPHNIITCECSAQIREAWLGRHLKSQRHLLELAELENQKQQFKLKKEEAIKRESQRLLLESELENQKQQFKLKKVKQQKPKKEKRQGVRKVNKIVLSFPSMDILLG